MDASAKEKEDIENKMKYLNEQLNKDSFAQPIKEVQTKMRDDLIELKKIFQKNLTDLNKDLSNKNSSLNKTKATSSISNEELTDLKTALEHKTYQAEILKKAFSEYETKAETQIDDLKTENAKLQYRVQILLNTINELETKK